MLSARDRAIRIGSSDITAFVLLTALNLAICWRLFKVGFTDHFSSIEGAFIAIARYISQHWSGFSWWPLWHCGMPYQDTYVPMLHIAAAAVASLANVDAARAYHGVVGLTYALGAGTLYLMATSLGAGKGAAFASALFYSLYSPSALLMTDVARDLGGYWSARRLQILTVYGEGPHISAMTVLPLVIVALQLALTRRNSRSLALAALAMALVFVTNVPGTMATGLAVFCWLCAQPAGLRGKAWLLAASAAVLAYCLDCFAIPPSSLATVGGNVGSMHPGFSNSLKYGPIPLALVLCAVVAAGRLLAKLGVPLAVRFAILFFGLLAPLSITARVETFELLPQVGRLQLEAEMGACLLLGSAVWAVYRRLHRATRPAVLLLALVPIVIQFRHYRARAKMEVNHIDLEKRSEFTSARWLDRNRPGERVYVTGSTSFWLNAFVDSPQLIGCCDQGLSMPVLAAVPYAVNSPTSVEDTQKARVWLQALGVHALVVNGPASTDEYKDIQAPDRFLAVFPLLHEENGDRIYEVVAPSTSLAHVIRDGQQVPVKTPPRVEYPEIAKYAASIGPDTRPAAFQWTRDNQARIRANLQRGDILSVQVAWFPGWKAVVNGKPAAVLHDGLGFIALQPECQGDCEIDLSWTGRRDLPFARFLSAVTLLLLAAMIYKRRRFAAPPVFNV